MNWMAPDIENKQIGEEASLMRWGMKAAGNRLLCLAVLLALIPLPVLAQSPAYAAPGVNHAAPPPPYSDGPVSLAPDWQAPRIPAWDIYVKAGPVVPLAESFSEHFKTGWTIQAGVQVPILCLSQQAGLIFFGEFGGEYAGLPGDESPEETRLIVAAPPGVPTLNVINAFFLTEIRELKQAGVHGALGWSFDPAALTRTEPSRIRLDGRMGFRAGGLDAAFRQTATPAGLQVLGALESFIRRQGGDPSSLRFGNDVRTDGSYFGLFWGLGVSVSYPDIRVGRFTLGDISLGAEVQFTHDWIKGLGDFKQHDTVLETITPLFTLAYSF